MIGQRRDEAVGEAGMDEASVAVAVCEKCGREYVSLGEFNEERLARGERAVCSHEIGGCGGPLKIGRPLPNPNAGSGRDERR
jgi:hypothetical protein